MEGSSRCWFSNVETDADDDPNPAADGGVGDRLGRPLGRVAAHVQAGRPLEELARMPQRRTRKPAGKDPSSMRQADIDPAHVDAAVPPVLPLARCSSSSSRSALNKMPNEYCRPRQLK